MIVDFFDNAFYRHIDSSKGKLCYNFLIRGCVKMLANVIVPISLRRNKWKYVVRENTNRSKKIIVSLTSFPARIHSVNYVIECILRQTVVPDKILLYLSKSQFANEELPNKLLSLKKRGVDIIFVDDDIRPHKKYYYAFKEYPNDIIITVDDDIFYPTRIIENLLRLSKEHPGSICCNRACFYSFKEDKLLPYSEWPIGNDSPFDLKGYNILPTGMGGVLYPPRSVNSNVYDIITIKENCINADDLWLNLNSRINDTIAVLSRMKFGFIPILSTLSSALSLNNAINGNANDKQIANLIKKYGITFYTKNLEKRNIIDIVY